MRYTATDGTTRDGEVWSPGPVTGSVWVQPYPGAPTTECVAVSLRGNRELTPERIAERRNAWNFDLKAREIPGDIGRLSSKAWYAALGYDPRDVARQTDQLALADMAA